MISRLPYKILLYLIFFVTCISVVHSRMVTFADHEWWVRSGYGGPGPNYWSDSDESVWVDNNGWLHLKIRYENGIWYCAEVNTTQPTRYGMHRFYVIGRLDSLDPNVVFAPFLYANDTTEIDIEFSRWSNEWSWFNTQYVVQPWYHPGNVERFWTSLNGTYTTHYINWQPDSIRFKSIHGHYEEPPHWWYLIHSWLYTGADIPQQYENLFVCINLWLCDGNPPSNGEEVEIIVKDVDLPFVGANEAYHVGLQLHIDRTRTNIYFKYMLPTSANVTLTVYDAMGRDIRRWCMGIQSPGDHVIHWDGTNKHGCRVTPGVYFCRLMTGNLETIRKFIILR